jgi:aspartate-semialdehyde dehydrogenase
MPELPGSFTCVRVPTLVSHGVAAHLELERDLEPNEALAILRSSPGVIVGDGQREDRWPTPREAAGRDEVFVGRVRRDPCVEGGLQLWAVGDNLRKGAATNAVQIAEMLERP